MREKAIAYRFLKYGAVAYLLTYLATCELLRLPSHSYCHSERSVIDAQEALRRVIASEGMAKRRSLFPGVPERTPEEVYAASPKSWGIKRTLLGYSSAWEVTVKERIANVDRPGTWEGIFLANLCADRITQFWMAHYDDEKSSEP